MAAINQTRETQTKYSAAVHGAIGMGFTVMFGVLQQNKHQSPVLEADKPILLGFCVSFAMYAVFGIFEQIVENTEMPSELVIKLVGHMPSELVIKLVGDTSHFFGSLAILALIYELCSTFALVFLFFWFLWCLRKINLWVSEVKKVYDKMVELETRTDNSSPRVPAEHNVSVVVISRDGQI